MKYVSKTIVVLEMDEHEMEVVLGSVATAADSKHSSGTIRKQAQIFMKDYQEASELFHQGRHPEIK